MIDISLSKISKNYGFDQIFENISCDINNGEKIAIVGENGCGKTTLLNIIAGYENINSGNVSLRKNIKIGYLKQNININKNENPLITTEPVSSHSLSCVAFNSIYPLEWKEGFEIWLGNTRL